MSLGSFNFADLGFFAKDVPHDVLTELRRDDPVYWNNTPGTAASRNGFWLITKYKDIVQIERNPRLFSSHYGLTLAEPPASTSGPPWSMVRDGLTHLDPPEHDAYRRIIAPPFTPLAVAAMEARIRDIAREVIDRACSLHECDFADDVALAFSVAVILGELFGLPREDFARVIHWSDVIAAPRDPEFPRSAAVKVVQEMHDYGLSILALRRRTPQHDLLSVLAHTKMPDGSEMKDEIFMRYFWSLVTGAFDTTASAIAGGMLALLTFPKEYAKLCLQPELLPNAVEEMLRWETPTLYFRRTAMEDTEIRDKRIERGQRVLMCYASGNRDEEIFSNAHTFDVSRKPNDHLSFGRGVHFCLGSSIARAEIRIIFEQIIQRRLNVQQRGEVRRACSNFQNRIKQMPVTISEG